MGVLQCNRNGCENIMCDRLSHTHGYICFECFEELVSLGIETHPDDFMKSKKNKSETFDLDFSRSYFSGVFPDKW